ncbi:sperm-associated antigen 8 isoform 3-T3 [Glossophaga mutica]
METFDSTEGPQSRSFHVHRSSQGPGSSPESIPSSDGGPMSAPAAATAAAAAAATATATASAAEAAVLSAKTEASSSEQSLLVDSTSDSLLEKPCTGPTFTHKIGHEKIGFKPDHVSYVAQDPCTINDLSSSPGPGTGSNAGPVLDSSSGLGHGSGQGTGPDPACDSGPTPGCGNGPELSPDTLTSSTNPGSDLVPNCASGNHYQQWEPKKHWKFLQVSEPAAGGLWKSPKVEGKCEVLSKTLPRGQCLLYNWEEERATNHLDQVPSMQDGSESFYFRHGHRGLLTLQLQAPMPFSTTQKDSYQPPENQFQPTRGKREAMLEMLLCHQICLTTTVRSSLKLSGYRGHHSYRGSVTSGHWIHHSGRTAASPHQCLCPWGSLCPMNSGIIPTSWEKSLPLAVREEGRVAERAEVSKA